MIRTTDQIVCIGASTGGTESLREVLTALPPNSPGIVIVQHMPAMFTHPLAVSLDKKSAIRVKEAQDGEIAQLNYAYVAPGLIPPGAFVPADADA